MPQTLGETAARVNKIPEILKQSRIDGIEALALRDPCSAWRIRLARAGAGMRSVPRVTEKTLMSWTVLA